MFVAEALPWATASIQWKYHRIDRRAAVSASSYVLMRLRGDILSAYFKPNAKLYLKVLTSRYETSVAPVGSRPRRLGKPARISGSAGLARRFHRHRSPS
jgi:hypothetical protein